MTHGIAAEALSAPSLQEPLSSSGRGRQASSAESGAPKHQVGTAWPQTAYIRIPGTAGAAGRGVRFTLSLPGSALDGSFCYFPRRCVVANFFLCLAGAWRQLSYMKGPQRARA